MFTFLVFNFHTLNLAIDCKNTIKIVLIILAAFYRALIWDSSKIRPEIDLKQ